MTQIVTSSQASSIQALINDALVQAGVSPTARTVSAETLAFLYAKGDQAPPIPPSRGQLSASQMMILLEKLLGISGDHLMETMRNQVDSLEQASRSQLQEHLKKFNEMVAQQAKERASRSRSGVLGWIQKVATLVVSVVVLAAIVTPIIAGTAGVGAVPVIMALMALWSAGGALTDIAMTATSGKSLGEEMGSDWGAALTTCSLGELSAIGLKEAGANLGWQIAVALLVTVAVGVLTYKLGTASSTPMMKVLARTTDLTLRTNMASESVTNIGQGVESLTQADIHKWISELKASLVGDQTKVTANQEMTDKLLEVVRAVQETLTKMFGDAAESVSREFQGLRVLVDAPSRRHAVA